MKLIPRTLLGRTALSLGLLLLVGDILWLGTIYFFCVRPIKESYKQQVRDMAVMAQALTELQLKHPDPSLGKVPALPSFRVVEDSALRPDFEPNSDREFPEMEQMLTSVLGPSARVERQKSNGFVWIRFPAANRLFWLILPLSWTSYLPVVMLLWVSIWLFIAIIGAYLIIFHLTRQLRQVTHAARAVGRGELGDPLSERGPTEIRDLSSAFNQMAVDLRRLDADRRVMLAGISHDLRTPLTRMRLEAELLGAAEPAAASGMVRDIEEMDAILKQFLDYARDGSEEKAALGDLNFVVEDVCQGYWARGHAVECEFGLVPKFTFRRQAMRRIVTNLLDNAVRYGRKDVRVTTQPEERSAVIVVSDGGPGISEALAGNLVKPFVREDASRSSSGSGLGLVIVERMVRLHGGTWQFKNRPEGGLIVTVVLPLEPD